MILRLRRLMAIRVISNFFSILRLRRLIKIVEKYFKIKIGSNALKEVSLKFLNLFKPLLLAVFFGSKLF
jgi:hypothetical protein